MAQKGGNELIRGKRKRGISLRKSISVLPSHLYKTFSLRSVKIEHDPSLFSSPSLRLPPRKNTLLKTGGILLSETTPYDTP